MDEEVSLLREQVKQLQQAAKQSASEMQFRKQIEALTQAILSNRNNLLDVVLTKCANTVHQAFDLWPNYCGIELLDDLRQLRLRSASNITDIRTNMAISLTSKRKLFFTMTTGFVLSRISELLYILLVSGKVTSEYALWTLYLFCLLTEEVNTKSLEQYTFKNKDKPIIFRDINDDPRFNNTDDYNMTFPKTKSGISMALVSDNFREDDPPTKKLREEQEITWGDALQENGSAIIGRFFVYFTDQREFSSEELSFMTSASSLIADAVTQYKLQSKFSESNTRFKYIDTLKYLFIPVKSVPKFVRFFFFFF